MVGVLRNLSVLIVFKITFRFIHSHRLVVWLETELLVKLRQFMNAKGRIVKFLVIFVFKLGAGHLTLRNIIFDFR